MKTRFSKILKFLNRLAIFFYPEEQRLYFNHTYSAAKLTQIMEFIKRWSKKLSQTYLTQKLKKKP